MNYMKEVAQMLGVKLGEEFKISYTHDIFHGRSKYNFVITENGLIEIIGESSFETNELLVELLNERCKVIKLSKTILDEVEKRYLSNVIKPFRDKVISICKHGSCERECEFIAIKYSDIEKGFIFLPFFKKDTMYKGMEIGKIYTLEELGL